MRKKSTAIILTIVLLLGASSDASNVLVTSATSNTRQEIERTQREKEEWENRLNQNQEELNDLKGEQNSLKRELNKLNLQLAQVVDNLEELEQQIRDKEQEIANTREDLQAAREKEAWQYDCMVSRARFMYENKEENYFAALLKSGSLADILNTADYIEMIAAYDRKKMDGYMDSRARIEEEEARLENEMVELDNLKVQTEAEKSKVSGLVGQTTSSIGEYQEEISEAEQRALEYEEEIRRAEEDLELLKQRLAEEMALSAEAASGTWRDISEVSFAEGDRMLLANLIYCEAGGEPYAGQLAVGSVVINRVLSSKFPDTVVGVIYQNKQFSPVASGRLALALASNKATASCYKAADEAMSGVTNVGSCVFFRTPVPGLTGITIGGHVFY